jgi:hypothetical protein
MCACMEHTCVSCDWYACDNTRIHVCPKCGAPCTNHFDESPGREVEEDDEEDDDDD